jgi:hypothetical protein
VSQCEESGPPALAERWRRVTTGEELAELRFWTRRLHDRRLLDAVLSVAADGARERSVRLSALQVLVSYVDPAWTATLADLDDHVREPVLPGVADAQTPILGVVPAGADAGEQIVAMLRRVAALDGDPLAGSALWLWDALVRAKPALGIPDAARLSLTPVCGSRYQIVNPNLIPLFVQIVGLGDRDAAWIQVPAAAAKRINALAAVTMTYAGQEVASAIPSSTPCR